MMLTVKTKNMYGVENVSGGLNCYGQPNWTVADWKIGQLYGCQSGYSGMLVPINDTAAVVISQDGEGRATICGPTGPLGKIVKRGGDGWADGIWSGLGNNDKRSLLDLLRDAPLAARVPLADYRPVANSAGCLFAFLSDSVTE